MDSEEKSSLKDTIFEEVRNWIDVLRMDAAGDIDKYAEVLTGDLMEAIAAGRMDLAEEIKNQVQVLADTYRIHITSQSVKTLESIVGVIARIAAAALVK